MQYLRLNNYGITSLDGEGRTGKVKLVFIVIKLQDLPRL
jgi:hypothetical protein